MKEIELTQGYVTQVDDEDYAVLSQFSWSVSCRWNTCYARGSHGKLMHRMIMQASDNMEVDHRDGDGLNNQRHNLKVCTHAENVRNRRELRQQLDNVMMTNFAPLQELSGEQKLLKAIFEL